jgi:hypothetical protein
VVGRIFKANASPVGAAWMWTLAFGHHEDRTSTHGYAERREAAAMAAFAKELAAPLLLDRLPWRPRSPLHIRQICDGHHRQRLNKLLWDKS